MHLDPFLFRNVREHAESVAWLRFWVELGTLRYWVEHVQISAGFAELVGTLVPRIWSLLERM